MIIVLNESSTTCTFTCMLMILSTCIYNVHVHVSSKCTVHESGDFPVRLFSIYMYMYNLLTCMYCRNTSFTYMYNK